MHLYTFVTERRLNIRVSPALFDELDDKRHRLKTTFQAVCLKLLTDWLDKPATARFRPPP